MTRSRLIGAVLVLAAAATAIFLVARSSDAAIPIPLPVEQIITFSSDGMAPDGDEYCVYRILTAEGEHPDFAVGNLVCIDCPGTCPGPFDRPGRFRLIDADGNTLVTGKWGAKFYASNPSGCRDCPGGATGYVFVN